MPRPYDPVWVNRLCCVYAFMLGAYPKSFRIQFGDHMQQVFRDRCRAAAFWLLPLYDVQVPCQPLR